VGRFAIQRRMLEAEVAGGTERERGSRQHAPFVQDAQCGGHGAHTRTDAQGRIADLAPEVIRGHTRGRQIEPARLRQQTRQVRQQGQMRLHHFGFDIDPGLWGQTVDVLLEDEAVRLEPADQLLVSYPGVYDPKHRRLTAGDATGRQPYR
jgi:hypothetical protein